jgi:hypothetical protein
MNKLINYSYLKEETDISDNIEPSVLDNPIKWAHDQLEFTLGRLFYAEIQTQGTVPTSFSSNNSALFDPYIKQFLAWTAYHDYLVNANNYSTRTGFRTFKEENSDAASDQAMNTRIKRAADKVQFYKGKMINYILDAQNTSSLNYPLYKTDCNQKFGTGFGISGVTKVSTSQYDLTVNKIRNGY